MKASIRIMIFLCISVDARQVFPYHLFYFFSILAQKNTPGRHLQQALAEQQQVKTPPQANANQNARVLILWQSLKTSEDTLKTSESKGIGTIRLTHNPCI